MLYKMSERSSNRLPSLVIQNVNLASKMPYTHFNYRKCITVVPGIAEFERTFIDVLSEAKATQMLRQGMSTMLAHASPTANQLRILNLQR